MQNHKQHFLYVLRKITIIRCYTAY